MKTRFACVWLACIATCASAAEFDFMARNTKGEPLADAALSLVPLDAPVPPPSSAGRTEVAQESQEFGAYVTVVQAGSTVYFPNKDTVQHHVYSLSKAKKFELPLYNPGRAESFVFDTPGLITLGCNIHDWMIAYLVVVPTPYFGKTAADGTAHLSAPAGRYRLELWHPRQAAPVTEEITLTDSATTVRKITLTLKPDRRVRRGPESKGRGY
ncbi:MAG: hypothetical protein JWQ62_1954 [Lacunisphaera sp.]|nr:hypothetical protein [Lacunisphaera sp.]